MSHHKPSLVLALGAIAGCATSSESTPPAPAGGAAPPASDPAGATKRVDENLARLRGLAIVEVVGLVVDAPAGAYACYGPCPEFAAAIAAAEEKSAVRLERLVAVAATAAPDGSAASCERAAIERNLAALRELKIVTIGALIEDKPESSGNCYGQVCPDVEAAREKNCERAAKLAGIVAAARSL